MADSNNLFNNTGALVFLGGVLLGAAAVSLLGSMKKPEAQPVAAAAEEIVITEGEE